MVASGNRGLAGGDLREGAADVHGAGAAALRRPPRHGAGEGIVELEHAGATPEAAKRAAIAPREAGTRDALEARRIGVEEDGALGAEAIEGIDAIAHRDLASERAQGGRERVGDALRASASHRPPRGVGGSGEDERERGGERRVEPQEGVRRKTRHQRPGALAAETKRCGRQERAAAKSRHQQGMARDARDRPERVVDQILETRGERPDDAGVGLRVGAEPCRRVPQRPDQRDGGPVVERVRDGDLGVDPFEPVLRETQPGEERRGRRHGMDRRADVVHEPRQRQRGAAGAAPDRRLRLVDAYRQACPGERDGSGEPVRSAPDHRRVDHAPTYCRSRERAARSPRALTCRPEDVPARIAPSSRRGSGRPRPGRRREAAAAPRGSASPGPWRRRQERRIRTRPRCRRFLCTSTRSRSMEPGLAGCRRVWAKAAESPSTFSWATET